MESWKKILLIPMSMSLLVACSNNTTDEESSQDETETAEQTNSENVETGEESTETSDADSEATTEENGGWDVETASGLTPEEAFEQEDLTASGEAAKGTTISEVDMNNESWVEEAAEATDAVQGDTYVQLDHGVLTVDQIDNFLKAMPMELTYADDNNQFIYYNYMLEPEEMLGARKTGQVGNSLEDVHPSGTYENVSWVIAQLRSGEEDMVRMAVSSGTDEQFVVHDYYAIRDDEGNFMGINEAIHDIKPYVDFYLEETGAEITYPEGADTDSGATE